jgi:hypothetical protein
MNGESGHKTTSFNERTKTVVTVIAANTTGFIALAGLLVTGGEYKNRMSVQEAISQANTARIVYLDEHGTSAGNAYERAEQEVDKNFQREIHDLRQQADVIPESTRQIAILNDKLENLTEQFKRMRP